MLSRSLADVRQEHARLLGWKQEPLLWAVYLGFVRAPLVNVELISATSRRVDACP